MDRRRRVFNALLELYPHDLPSDIPALLARYAVVSQHEDAFDDGAGYWILTTESPEEDLKVADEDVERHGYVPLLVVDLDTGCSYTVKSIYALGQPDARHDFSALVTQVELDPSPRARASGLAERP